MNKVAITKIVLEMGEVRVELSLKDAEELFNSLERMFGNKTNYYPIYTKPYSPWWYYPSTYTVNCGDNSWKLNKNASIMGTTLTCNVGNLSSARLSG